MITAHYQQNLQYMTSTEPLNNILSLIELNLIPIAIVIIVLLSGVIILLRKKNKIQKLKIKLIEKKYVTHDTVVFTFLLPQTHKTLGLKVGEHIQIEALIDGKIVNRKYTPISRIDRKQTIQLLIKIYHKCQQFPQGGAMSLYLDSLPIDSEISISSPYGRFNYISNGLIQIRTLQRKKQQQKRYSNIVMVAGGTGITPLYQIIQYISQSQKTSQLNLTLLFANRTQDDILMLNQLQTYEQLNKKLKIYYSVDRTIRNGWDGMVGYVDEDKLAKVMKQSQNDIQNTLFLSCGPPVLSNIVEKIWIQKFAVKTAHIFRF